MEIQSVCDLHFNWRRVFVIRHDILPAFTGEFCGGIDQVSLDYIKNDKRITASPVSRNGKSVEIESAASEKTFVQEILDSK